MNVMQVLEEVYGKDWGRTYQVKDIKFRGLTFRFPKGIYFECVNCGNCCIYEDIGLLPDEANKYPSKQLQSGWSIIDKKYGEPCPFLKDNKCSIYEERPSICREYPWGSMAIETKDMKDILTFKLMIDKINQPDKMCNGFHKGKMTKQHLKPFVNVCKQRAKLLMRIEMLRKQVEDKNEVAQ